MNASALAATAAPPPSLAVLAGHAGIAPLTRVSLAYIEQRIDVYLRFGEPARTVRLDRWRRVAVFLPGALFFGAEVKDALRQRADFLVEQGLAEHRGQRVVLARNLLATLRGRELAQAAKDIAAETGLEHRPVTDGQRMAGIYRRSVMLASGRYAVLDDGMGFSLVPWKPMIEQRLGQQVAATIRGSGATWVFGRQRSI